MSEGSGRSLSSNSAILDVSVNVCYVATREVRVWV